MYKTYACWTNIQYWLCCLPRLKSKITTYSMDDSSYNVREEHRTNCWLVPISPFLVKLSLSNECKARITYQSNQARRMMRFFRAKLWAIGNIQTYVHSAVNKIDGLLERIIIGGLLIILLEMSTRRLTYPNSGRYKVLSRKLTTMKWVSTIYHWPAPQYPWFDKSRVVNWDSTVTTLITA